MTEGIKIERGARQGDTLAATLFITSLDCIIKQIEHIGTLNKKSVQIIAYADDIAIITRRKKYLGNTFRIIKQASKERGLTINESKTKYMQCDRKKDKQLGRQIEQYSFEEVETFKYLGIIIDRNNENVYIKQRIQQGYKAFYSNKKTLQDKRLSRNTKIKIYRTTIRPIVTYAIETANITKEEEAKLQVFERKVIRTIIGPKVIENGEKKY